MKFAPILGSNMTGRIGGVVASRNTYGGYFRRLVRPVNRNTTGQQAQRAAFAAVSQLWRSQSKASQNAWILAAPQHQVPNSIGGTLTLTGQALFMRMNTLRQRIGLPLIAVAPSTDDVPAITGLAVEVDLSGQATVTFNGADEWNLSNGGVLVSVSPLQAQGVNFIGQFTDFGTDTGPTSSMTRLIPYDVAAGGLVRFRARATTPDGRLSDFAYVDATLPQQAIILEFLRTSSTTAQVTFSRPTPVTDFAFGDFTLDAGTVTAIAQGTDTVWLLTGTGLAGGTPYVFSPSGAGANYSPEQSGVITA
jgi:hypothetical protein